MAGAQPAASLELAATSPPTWPAKPTPSAGSWPGPAPANGRRCTPRRRLGRTTSRPAAVASGLDLQVDLDTSAEHLADAFAGLDAPDRAGGLGPAWDVEVELRGGQRAIARLLPLARLTEVVLHHVDLDIGFEVADIDDETAEWLLEWSAYRLGARDEFPRLELVSDTGFHTTLGSSGAVRRIAGSSSALLGWLTGRAAPDTVRGSDGLVLPGL